MKSKTFKKTELFRAVETVERVSERVDGNDTCPRINESGFVTTATKRLFRNRRAQRTNGPWDAVAEIVIESEMECLKMLKTATAAGHPHIPARTIADRLRRYFSDRLLNSAVLFGVVPVGSTVGRWISKAIALPQLRKLAVGEIPWMPLRKPISECRIALISTGGVHLHSDRPFHLNGDPTFRVIPKSAVSRDLAISHQAYDRTDALRDINLVFPLERLRELEKERVIGELAEQHYGFGLMGSAKALMPSIREVARRISEAGVDVALLVPA